MRMTKVALCWVVIIIILTCSSMAYGDCASVVSEDDAIRTLTKSEPNAIRESDKPCVSSSIYLLAELRSKRSIPLLISYLSYHRESLPGEREGIQMHPMMEGNEYPAVAALSQWGDEIRVPLLVVIESDTSSQLERDNAAHAIILSFKFDVSGGVQYLLSAKNAIGPTGQRNLESALRYLQGVPACLKSQDACSIISE